MQIRGEWLPASWLLISRVFVPADGAEACPRPRDDEAEDGRS
jgi:hypothetical protein